jgi:hypothetical protein
MIREFLEARHGSLSSAEQNGFDVNRQLFVAECTGGNASETSVVVPNHLRKMNPP